MQRLVPGLKVWLDVDEGNRSNLATKTIFSAKRSHRPAPTTLEEKYQMAVECVDSMIVFLAGTFEADGIAVSTYFRHARESCWCRLATYLCVPHVHAHVPDNSLRLLSQERILPARVQGGSQV